MRLASPRSEQGTVSLALLCGYPLKAKGVTTQLAQQGQDVAGRAPGIGLQNGIALLADTVLGQIDEQFAQCCHIIVLAHLIRSVSASRSPGPEQ